MKTLLTVLTCLGSGALMADATVSVALAPSNAVEKVAVVSTNAPRSKARKTLTPEEIEAMREKGRQARLARDKAAAEKLGVSVEELKKRRADERKARREKREQEMAAKAGVSVEEFRQKRRAKHEEMLAKRLGVSVEEVRKMTPDELRAKQRELYAKRQAELKAKREKKESK